MALLQLLQGFPQLESPLTAPIRMPHPVRPNSLIMAQRCSDPWKFKRSSQTSLPNSDIMDRVFHL